MKGIEKFRNLIKKLENGKIKKQDSDGKLIEVDFVLNTPATETEIKAIEEKLGCNLPTSYIEFLKEYNGARIFDYEGLDGFVLLGTKDLEKINKFVAATFEDEWIDSILVFAKYIGEDNYLSFDTSTKESEYSVIDCFTEELPENWGEIANSFDDFLNNIVESVGKKYWLI